MASMEIEPWTFATLANLGKTYRDARTRAQREEILSSIPPDANMQSLGSLGLQLIRAGDSEGGIALARLADASRRDERDFALRERQMSPGYIRDVARTRAEVESEFAPKTTNIKTPTGDEITVEKGPGGYRIPQIEGAPTEPNNPFMTGGKMNEAQSKDALYSSRAMQSERVLRGIDANVATNPMDKMRSWASDKIGYNIRSPEFQKFDQARRDFVNAILRRESGAVISDAEFANANQQYFPQPGDTAEVLAQKRTNRMEAIRGIGAGAGQGYRPEFKFDPGGEIVPNAPQRSAQPQPAAPRPLSRADVEAARANPQAALQAARDAITAGKPRDAVIRRLRDVGIDPAGL